MNTFSDIFRTLPTCLILAFALISSRRVFKLLHTPKTVKDWNTLYKTGHGSCDIFMACYSRQWSRFVCCARFNLFLNRFSKVSQKKKIQPSL